MENRAQVSLEYLLTVMFAVALAIAAAVLATNLTGLAEQAKNKILEERNSLIGSMVE